MKSKMYKNEFLNEEGVCMLPDTQNQNDIRDIPIDKVGIKSLKYPIVVKDKDNGIQHTIATISMTVDLPKEFKGTHMSRFVEVLMNKKEIHIDSIYEILKEMQNKLKSQTAHIELEFPYFREKLAPVSKKPSLIDYKIRYHAVVNKDKKDLIMTVVVPVKTLCPCSKNISKYGAHNQRGEVTVSVRFSDNVWFEDIISMIEKSASSELYTLLKREDEKYVTEKAYENPVFVEDVVRNVVVKLKANEDILWYSVEAENFESIHNHNAYAMIESHEDFSNGHSKDFMIKRY
ncbi:MAG: GTP cyclohydrolase FolE2 [Ignavibacteriota bacterium]|nr:GTP cyclohydrolase FolE2 [Ignavibacteriota bacterium]